MKQVEQTLPAHWASYLINGDASGIAYAERVTIDALLKSKGLPSPVSCSEETRFSRTNDAGTLPGDVLTYAFLLPEDKVPKLDTFTRAYLIAALWTWDEEAPSGEYQDSGRVGELMPLFHEGAIESAVRDCAKFQELCAPQIAGGDVDRAGHDFWLTRNGHGCGFWETSDWEEADGKAMTAVCKDIFGEVDLYKGDDGKLYFSK